MTYFQIINHLPDLIANTLQPPLGSTDATEYHLSEKLWMVSVITFSPVVFELWAPPVGHKATACVACIAMQEKKIEVNQMK